MADDVHDRRMSPAPTLESLGLQDFAPFLVNRISATYNSQVQEMLHSHDLTTPKMRTLAVLATQGPLTVNELAYLAVFEQSTMSRTLDALEKQGFVQREQRATDMRVRELRITEAGRSVFESFWPALYRLYDDMFEGVAPSDRERLIDTLHRVLANLNRTPQKGGETQD